MSHKFDNDARAEHLLVATPHLLVRTSAMLSFYHISIVSIINLSGVSPRE